jgi:hypothetical protein
MIDGMVWNGVDYIHYCAMMLASLQAWLRRRRSGTCRGIGLWMDSLWCSLLLLDAINRLEICVVGDII